MIGSTIRNPFGPWQNGNASFNPFNPPPFGTPTPFGSHTGARGSISGGASTGVLGANSSSLGPTSTFGSLPAFATSTAPATALDPGFEALSFSPRAFGQSISSSFGAPSVFGQNSNALSNQITTSPFGFSSPFVSTTGGSLFGGTSTREFGANSSPLGATLSLGTTSTPAFETSTASACASAAFRTSSTTYGGGIGTTGYPSLNTFSPSSTTPTFGTTGFAQLSFGGQHGGSRRTAYSATAELDNFSKDKLQSISAMPVNDDKSHEELRWEDYRSGDKGGPQRMGHCGGFTGSSGFIIPSNSSSTSPALAPSSVNPFHLPTTLHGSPFGQQNSFGGFSFLTSPTGAQSVVNPLISSTTSNVFAPATSSNQITPPTLSLPFAPQNSFGGFTIQLNFVSASPPVAQSFVIPLNSTTTSNVIAPAISSNQFTAPALSPLFTLQNVFGGFPIQLNFLSTSPPLAQSFANPLNSSTTSNVFAPATSSHQFTPPTLSPQFAGQNSFGGFPIQWNAFSTSPTLAQSSVDPFNSSITSNVVAPATSSFQFTTPTLSSSSTSDFFARGTLFPPFAPQNSHYQLATQTSPNPFAPLDQSSSSGPSLAPSLSQPNILNAVSNGSQFLNTPPLLSMTNSTGFTQATSSFPSSLQLTQTAQAAGGFANIKVAESSGLSSFQGTTGILGQSTTSQPSSRPPAPADEGLSHAFDTVCGSVRAPGFGELPSSVDAQVHQNESTRNLIDKMSLMQLQLGELRAMVIKGRNQIEETNEGVAGMKHALGGTQDRDEGDGEHLVHSAGNSMEQNEKVSSKGRSNLENAKCKLLHWDGTNMVVADGQIASTDPKSKVHDVTVGPGCWKVWVYNIKARNVPLFRPNRDMFVLEEAGCGLVAWPSQFIKLE